MELVVNIHMYTVRIRIHFTCAQIVFPKLQENVLKRSYQVYRQESINVLNVGNVFAVPVKEIANFTQYTKIQVKGATVANVHNVCVFSQTNGTEIVMLGGTFVEYNPLYLLYTEHFLHKRSKSVSFDHLQVVRLIQYPCFYWFHLNIYRDAFQFHL